MKLTTTLTISLLWALATAHSGLSTIYINGKNQGDSVCIRTHGTPSLWNAPIEDLSSVDMACGRGADQPIASGSGNATASRVCPVQDGDTVTFEYRQEAQKPNDVVFDARHVGPCSVYAKKVDSAVSGQASGDGWFKLWHAGYDESSKKWCTDSLIAAGGRMSVVMPKGLMGGYYLLRSEFLALQNAKDGDPQYYVGCAQVFLQSDGTLKPEKTVKMPGLVEKSDASDSFNVYETPMKLPYPIPGPDVVKLVAGEAKGEKEQKEGVRPAGCVDEVGNAFCGIELPDYKTKEQCQASTKKCWDQSEVCFKNVPATGNAGCNAWQSKCQQMQDDCNTSSPSGPKDKGKDLTPEKKDLNPIPPPLANGVAVSGSSAKTSTISNSTIVSSNMPRGNGTVTSSSGNASRKVNASAESAVLPVASSQAVPSKHSRVAGKTDKCNGAEKTVSRRRRQRSQRMA